MVWKCQNQNKCPDVSGLYPSSVECSLMFKATSTSYWFKIWKLRCARACELQMNWKSALRPRGWHVPRGKMRGISYLFLCLLPSQSLIPRTSASAAVCPLELKCSATWKPCAIRVSTNSAGQVSVSVGGWRTGCLIKKYFNASRPLLCRITVKRDLMSIV